MRTLFIIFDIFVVALNLPLTFIILFNFVGISLLVPLAKQFNANITNNAVERIFKQVKDRGFDVLLELLVKSVMQALPYPNARHPALQNFGSHCCFSTQGSRLLCATVL